MIKTPRKTFNSIISSSRASLERVVKRVPRRIRVTATLITFGLCLIALGYLGFETSRKINLDRLELLDFIWSFLAGLGYFISIAFGWIILTNQTDIRRAFANWSRTQALHFVPGGLLTPATRAYTLEGTRSRKVSAVLIESALETSLAAAVAGVALSTGSSIFYALGVLVVVAVLTIAINLKSKTTIGTYQIYGATVLLFLGRCSYCIAIYFAQLSLGLGKPSFWAIVGASALSWIVGYVAVFSPGGIGVREIVYASILTSGSFGSRLSSSAASGGALAGRLSLSLAEIAVLVVSGIYFEKTPPTSIPENLG